MIKDTNQTPHPQAPAMTAAGLNLIAQALTIYDSDLRLVVSNAPFQTMFDLPKELSAPGSSFEDTIRFLASRGEYGEVEDIDRFVAERAAQARAFEPHYMERTRANGRTISVEGSPLPDGGWVTVYTDITRTKQQEKLLRAHSDALSEQLLAHTEELSATNRELAASITALEETKRRLTESEARTRLTTEMMPAHIAHVNADGIYTYSNQRLPSVLPHRGSNIVGLHISDALGADVYAKIQTVLTQAYLGEHKVQEFTDDHSGRRVRLALTPDEQGGLYVMSMDITEETQTRATLQQSRRRALAAQMISGLAHDFSNLLTIILGLQSRLARLPDPSGEAAALIDSTLAAAQRGGALLDTIADVTGPRTLRPAATDLNTMMEELATLAKPTLPPDIALHLNLDLPEQPILLDRGSLQDSLLNLILNARDACGASGDITITARVVHDTWIEWRVQDSGPGFSDAALEHALDPFFTTKGAKGTGLGLCMTYDATQLAGGDLQIANTASGAKVTLRLPLRLASPTATGLVLLVEDRDDLRRVIRDMLIDLGHSVIEAASVDEACALLATLPDISLVLSDLQLKGEASGVDLAHRMGSSPAQLVFMTSLSDNTPLFRDATNMAPVLSKPFNASDLAALINQKETAAE